LRAKNLIRFADDKAPSPLPLKGKKRSFMRKALPLALFAAFPAFAPDAVVDGDSGTTLSLFPRGAGEGLAPPLNDGIRQPK
jgi:hypothetical protein